jgi:hypothetical protein
MAIIISKGGKRAKIERSDFEHEDYLQQLVHKDPETIPLYDIKEDIRLLVLAREFPTNSGAIDVLGVDRDGDIYCVETKLYKNPDKRLVVAQVLDYGASLWKSYADFRGFVTTIEKLGGKVSLQQRLTEFFGLAEEEVADLLDNMRGNMHDARFKFVVLMDRLHDQLKDLIVFLNQNSQFTVYAVEVDYYKHEGYEILFPKLYGAEVKKPVGVSSTGRKFGKWDEGRFFAEAKKNLTPEQLKALRKLYEFSKNTADEIGWGTGVVNGSFGPKVHRISNKSLFTVYTSGHLNLNFGWLKGSKAAVKGRDLYAKYLSETGRFEIPSDYHDSYPGVEVETWASAVDDFIAAIRKLLGEFKKGEK